MDMSAGEKIVSNQKLYGQGSMDHQYSSWPDLLRDFGALIPVCDFLIKNETFTPKIQKQRE